MLVPALALTFNAFVWGVAWWPLRQLESLGLHPLWTTAIAYALSVAVITVVRPLSWRQLGGTPALWVLVVGAGVTNASFNWGVTVGDVVRVVLLFYLMPLWAVLLARALLHERLTALALFRVALALLGAAIVLWPDDGSGWPWPRATADWLGLIGGAAFALNNVMLRHQRNQPEGARALAMLAGGAIVALVLALAIAPPIGVVVSSNGSAALWLTGAIALGALFLLSNLALQYGAARLSANATAVIMLSEVVFAAVSAVALGASALTPQVVVGGVLIVAAAAMAALQPAPWA